MFQYGDIVDDDFRSRRNGFVDTASPLVTRVQWPDGMTSTYGGSAADEFLVKRRSDPFALLFTEKPARGE